MQNASSLALDAVSRALPLGNALTSNRPAGCSVVMRLSDGKKFLARRRNVGAAVHCLTTMSAKVFAKLLRSRSDAKAPTASSRVFDCSVDVLCHL